LSPPTLLRTDLEKVPKILLAGDFARDCSVRVFCSTLRHGQSSEEWDDSSQHFLFLVRAAVNQGGKGGGKTNNQAAQAIVQGKNPGGINQGQAGERVTKTRASTYLSEIMFEVMGTPRRKLATGQWALLLSSLLSSASFDRPFDSSKISMFSHELSLDTCLCLSPVSFFSLDRKLAINAEIVRVFWPFEGRNIGPFSILNTPKAGLAFVNCSCQPRRKGGPDQQPGCTSDCSEGRDQPGPGR
jgi:hypothetical protein